MTTVPLLIRREFLARVLTKGYVIATVLGLIAIVGLSFAPSLKEVLDPERQQRIAVVDETGLLFGRLSSELADRLSNGRPRYLLSQVGSEGEARQIIEAGDAQAYLVLYQAGVSEAEAYPASVRSWSRRRLLRTRNGLVLPRLCPQLPHMPAWSFAASIRPTLPPCLCR